MDIDKFVVDKRVETLYTESSHSLRALFYPEQTPAGLQSPQTVTVWEQTGGVLFWRDMASNTYIQHYIDGSKRLLRRPAKQGRKPNPSELVKVKIEIMTLPATKARAEAEAKKYGMSLSAYGDLALSLFDISKFSS